MREALSTTTQREQLLVLCNKAPVAVLATWVLGGCMTAFLASHVERGPLLWWFGALVGAASLRFVLALAARRALRTTPAPERWLWAFAALSVVTGAAWGANAILYLRPEEPLVFSMSVLGIAGICSAALSSLSAFLPAFWTFVAASLVPMLCVSLARGDLFGGAVFVMTFVFMAAISVFATVVNRTLVESMRLRIAQEQLVADLRLEKERAEHAMVAKSKFVAAASHDLRQPAHALGLFVGALRARVSREPEILRLTDRIDASTRALEELLDGILDISRLDAEAYRPEVVALPLEPIMRRVVDEHAEMAAEKGVELRLASSAAWVRSDARMLERMLRNLVSNAVRYTDAGKILVGARAGSPLRLCVWDQGCGIAPEHHEAIFEEFRQLHNPERDRSRGLGLGLAIVRRIGTLLGHVVTVRSVVGRGSCFAIELPPCGPERASVAAAVEPARDLTGITVLVIDDERLVRDALAELVTSWGGTPLLAGSGAEALLRAKTTRVDAIVADLRLRDEETGYQAVAAIRAALRTQVPALIVTGDTAEERIREAQATGLPLAHKPIQPGELRELLGRLIAGS